MLQILSVQNQIGMPWPVTRWMMQNVESALLAAAEVRADLEASPPETFGLRALLAQPKPGPGPLDDDLSHGTLADGRFVGMRCGRDCDPDRMTSCRLWFDWRQSIHLQVTFIRTQMPKWREIAKATLTLVDGFAQEAGQEGSGR